MKDYTNLDIFIESLTYTPPTILTSIPEDSLNKTPGSATADGNLDTLWTDPVGYPSAAQTRHYAIWDMGDTSSRSIGAKVTSTFNNQTHTWTLEGDNDNEFGSPTNVGQTTTLNNSIGFIVGSVQSFRYYRLKSSVPSSGGGSDAKIYEVYILDDFGGTVDVSLEIKDQETGVWFQVASASAMGSTTTLNAVHGRASRDEVSVSGSVKNFYLPKTQTDLRIRLVVSGGGSVTSCSIMKSGGL